MTLARKGSRAIHVEGRNYRWTVSPDSGCMWIIVEHEAGNQRLEARLSYADDPGDSGAQRIQRAQISPKVVVRAITHAVAEGWRPNAAGQPTFRLEDADEKIWRA